MAPTKALPPGTKALVDVPMVSDVALALLRPEVAEFAIKMEEKLAKKDGEGKTHWRALPIEALRRFLQIEIQELEAAMDFLSVDEQMGEAVDVANYALILWDRLRAEKEAKDV